MSRNFDDSSFPWVHTRRGADSWFFASDLGCPARSSAFPPQTQATDQVDDDNQDYGDRDLFYDDDDSADWNAYSEEFSSTGSFDSWGPMATEDHGIITAVRVRPMLSSEKKCGYRRIIDMGSEVDSWTRIVNPMALPPLPARGSSREFPGAKLQSELALQVSRSFDEANGKLASLDRTTHFSAQFTQEFKPDYSFWSFDRSAGRHVATQSTMHDQLGVFALETAWQGCNCSIFAYGQTKAGKTYTMMGNSVSKGLIPRICEGLFTYYDEAADSTGANTVHVSFVEIYDEHIYDLLSPASIKKPLKLREHPQQGVFVERSQRMHVSSCAELMQLIDDGNHMRSVGITTGGRKSSRSHTILTLSLTQSTTLESDTSSVTSRSAETIKKSNICLVDLAGSERVDHSDADGLRLRETGSINRTLATLADVVIALSRRRSKAAGKSLQEQSRQRTFVPYRNSVLTRLLKESLGGNAKTIMLGVVSPCCAHYEESLSTLKYIERTKNVVSAVRANVETRRDLVQELQDEVFDLKAKLKTATIAAYPIMASDASDSHCELSSIGVAELNQPDTVSDHLLPGKGPDAPPDTSVGRKGPSLTSSSNSANHYRRESERLECEIAVLKEEFLNRERDFQMEVATTRKLHECVNAQVLRQNTHLMKLVAIRRRWQSLRLYRALDRWRASVREQVELRSSERSVSEMNSAEQRSPGDTDYHGDMAQLSHFRQCEGSMKKNNDLEVGRREQKVQLPATGTRHTCQPVERCHETQSVVTKADELCRLVVEAFMFPDSVSPGAISRKATASKVYSVSPLEMLASSSEFDRPDMATESSECWGEVSHELFELASPHHWPFDSEAESSAKSQIQPLEEHFGDGNGATQRSERGMDGSLATPVASQSFIPPRDRDAIQSTLLLCIDSIDMARRSMGPCMRKLRKQAGDDESASTNTGLERGLLSCLDKKLIAMSELLEEAVTVNQLAALDQELPSPSKACCEELEAILGEFCLQIIARVCDQLPNSSSGCSAGRQQLEIQLESFQSRLKQQLLPAIARDFPPACEKKTQMTAVLVAVEVFGLSERIGVVLRAAEQKKRQRLAQTRMIEAYTFSLQNLTENITTLEARTAKALGERNALRRETAILQEAAAKAKAEGSQREYDLAMRISQFEEATGTGQDRAVELETCNREQAAHLEQQLISVLAQQTEPKSTRGDKPAAPSIPSLEEDSPSLDATDDPKHGLESRVVLTDAYLDVAAHDKDAQLELMVAHTSSTTRVDKRIEDANPQLAAALDCASALVAETQQLTESHACACATTSAPDEQDGEELSLSETMEQLRSHVQCLQAALEQAQKGASELTNRVNVQGIIHLQQSDKLQDLEALLNDANENCAEMEASFLALQCQSKIQVQDLNIQVAASYELAARAKEREAMSTMQNEEYKQAAIECLARFQEEGEIFACSLKKAECELSDMTRKCIEVREICARKDSEIATLKTCLNETRAELEMKMESARESSAQCTTLEKRLSGQQTHITRLENDVSTERQLLEKLRIKHAALEEAHGVQALLLSRTEMELASARELKETLEIQLEEVSGRDNKQADELTRESSATIDVEALRAELRVVSDRCSTQSTLIQKLEVGMVEALEKITESERERQELVSQRQDLIAQRGQKEEELQNSMHRNQQWETYAAEMEHRQEVERQAHMAMHEVMQHHELELQTLQIQTTALEHENHCRLHVLEMGIDGSTAEIRSLKAKLKANKAELQAGAKAAEERASALTAQTNEWQAKFYDEQSTSRVITLQLKTCQENLAETTLQLTQMKAWCTVLQTSVDELTHLLEEANETCLMQGADAESFCWRNDTRRVNQQTTNEAELVVHRHLSNLHAWFDTMISTPITMVQLKVKQTPPKRNGDSNMAIRGMCGSRFPGASVADEHPTISDEFLNVSIENHMDTDRIKGTLKCTTSCRKGQEEPCRGLLDRILAVVPTTRSYKQPEDAGSGTKGFEDLSTGTSPIPIEGCRAGDCVSVQDTPAFCEQEGWSEILQLRAAMMKLKAMLDAKDEMLRFLDDKLSRIERLPSSEIANYRSDVPSDIAK